MTSTFRTALRRRRVRVVSTAAIVALGAAVLFAHSGAGRGHMDPGHVDGVIAICLAVATGAAVLASTPALFPHPLPRAPRISRAFPPRAARADPVVPRARARASPARLQVFRL